MEFRRYVELPSGCALTPAERQTIRREQFWTASKHVRDDANCLRSKQNLFLPYGT